VLEYLKKIRRVWDCSAPRFSAPLHVFLPKRLQFHAVSSRKKDGVVRAPKKLLHKLHFFMELLHNKICGAVSNTPYVRPGWVGCPDWNVRASFAETWAIFAQQTAGWKGDWKFRIFASALYRKQSSNSVKYLFLSPTTYS